MTFFHIFSVYLNNVASDLLQNRTASVFTVYFIIEPALPSSRTSILRV